MEEINGVIISGSSYQFSDGTKMTIWYVNLKKTIKKIKEKQKQGKELTDEKQEKIEIYEEIEKVRKKYNIEYQRKEEYIAKMAELDGVINQRSDYKFSDGTKMGTWYPKIKQTIKKIKEKIVQGKELEEEEQEKLEIHQEIEEAIWNLGYKSSCEYVSMYKDLHPIKYKTASKYELSKWLDEQRINYQLQNKDEVQLQHEQKLFELYPGWLYKTKEQYLDSIVTHISQQTSETIDDIHTNYKNY